MFVTKSAQTQLQLLAKLDECEREMTNISAPDGTINWNKIAIPSLLDIFGKSYDLITDTQKRATDLALHYASTDLTANNLVRAIDKRKEVTLNAIKDVMAKGSDESVLCSIHDRVSKFEKCIHQQFQATMRKCRLLNNNDSLPFPCGNTPDQKTCEAYECRVEQIASLARKVVETHKKEALGKLQATAEKMTKAMTTYQLLHVITCVFGLYQSVNSLQKHSREIEDDKDNLEMLSKDLQEMGHTLREHLIAAGNGIPPPMNILFGLQGRANNNEKKVSILFEKYKLRHKDAVSTRWSSSVAAAFSFGRLGLSIHEIITLKHVFTPSYRKTTFFFFLFIFFLGVKAICNGATVVVSYLDVQQLGEVQRKIRQLFTLSSEHSSTLLILLELGTKKFQKSKTYRD